MRFALLFLLLTVCGGATNPPHAFSNVIGQFHDGERLVVVGDLQRTAPLLEFWREQNDAERTRIVRAIAAARPDLLVITGDCVFNGGSDSQWTAFDALVAPLHRQGVTAIAAFGNHEYWGGRAAAEAHFFPRFPLDARRHWFGVAFGPLRVIVLDGNKGHLTDPEWQSQVDWYQNALRDFDRDPAIRGVLVVLHQPPYTNSTVTGDELQVQCDLVPPLTHSKKGLGMLSGHVHSYERFVRAGKTFVVSGGGGGPRAELAVGSARRHDDDQFSGPALRDFNFTAYTLTRHGVDAQVMGLPKGGTQMRVMDRFHLAWPE